MKLKKNILTLAGVLIMSYYFPVFGQNDSSAIPLNILEEHSLGTLQKLYPNRNIRKIESSCPEKPGLSVLGKSLGFYFDTIPTDDRNKRKYIIIAYSTNGCWKEEYQFDVLMSKEDYCISTFLYGSECYNFWTEQIKVEIISNSEITINSPIDAIVEIHKAYWIIGLSPIIKFFVDSNNNNHNYNVDLKDNEIYFIVFRNPENDVVVNIQRIGG